MCEASGQTSTWQLVQNATPGWLSLGSLKADTDQAQVMMQARYEKQKAEYEKSGGGGEASAAAPKKAKAAPKKPAKKKEEEPEEEEDDDDEEVCPPEVTCPSTSSSDGLPGKASQHSISLHARLMSSLQIF